MSWLPSIPSIPFIPSASIQSRFISFILRRTLGRFTQLDDHQIDSQIGSGFVTVKDVTLSEQAVNEILANSNVPLSFRTGTLGTVVVRIPWPNPLTSTIGLEIDNLDLILHLSPNEHPPPNFTVPDIAQSVTSLSETFIHDELDDREERVLRESISSHLPGALGVEEEDPFLANPVQEGDKDPEGVSIFASLLERVLARFQFTIRHVKITLVAPEGVRWILRIGELRYASDGENEREKRLVVQGVSLGILDAETLVQTPTSRSSPIDSPRDVPAPRSPASSSSSLDEPTQLMMSTSLAFLPPRPSTPPPPLSFADLQPSPLEEDSDDDVQSSVDSSVYQSAIGFSTTSSMADRDRTPSPGRNKPSSPTTPQSLSPSSRYVPGAFMSSPPRSQQQATPAPLRSPPESLSATVSPRPPMIYDIDDNEDTILTIGSDDIIISLVTPATSVASEPMRLNTSIGIITVAVHASIVKRALELLDSLPSTPSAPSHPPKKSSFAFNLDGACSTRGIVVVIYPELHRARIDLASLASSPLVPPKLEVGASYTRLWVDNIQLKIRFGFSIASSTIAHISDISAFAFSCDGGTLLAKPLLITDSSLSSLSDVVDWTDKEKQQRGAKVSTWRTGHRYSASSRPEPSPAIKASLKADEFGIEIVPVHIFLDVNSALGPVVSGWLSTAFAARQNNPGAPENDSQKAAEEEERRRLVEELDLGIDYGYGHMDEQNIPSPHPSKTHRPKIPASGKTALNLDLSMLRLEVRCPSPPMAPAPRSGSLVVDLHSVHVSAPPPADAPRTRARFATSTDDGFLGVDKLAQISFQQISVGYAPVKEAKAKQLVLISHLTPESTPPSSPRSTHDPLELSPVQPGGAALRQRPFVPPTAPKKGNMAGSPRQGGVVHGSPSSPKQQIPGNASTPKQSKATYAPSVWETPESIALSPKLSINRSKTASSVLVIEFPSINVDLSKPVLDGLQYWADDLTQFFERNSLASPVDEGDTDTERGGESMIGSRFFAQSKRSGSSRSFDEVGRQAEGKGDMIVKVAVTEVRVKASVLRAKEATERPFEILASDIDIILEVKPEGKDETRITIDVMDLTIQDTNASGIKQTLLSLTPSHSLIATSQNIVKLRFTSSNVPGTKAKESKIQLTLSRFTYSFFPDLAWAEDLMQFVKAPPGAFESVPPSERTKVSLRFMDGSLRVSAPDYLGALLLYLGDASFSTDIIGDSESSQFVTNIGATSVLFIDDITAKPEANERRQAGVLHWIKLEGYALVAELQDTIAVFTHTNKGADAPHSELRVDQIRLKAHLCADTLAELILFGQQLSSVFQPLPEQRQPKPKRHPSVVTEPAQKIDLLASIEDMAFKAPPEIGPAPDLINDDLPTNPDYLDQSFGAAGGFREIMDEDLDDFDDDGDDYVKHDTSVQGQQPQAGTFVSRVGGETIRMLQNSLNIVEHHFDTLPPESTDGSFKKNETSFQIRANKGDITLCLYDGYDWLKTRRTIEGEVKQMRKRLAKIKQLVATGQTQDPTVEDTSSLLFNSVYIGLEENVEDLEPAALILAIDKELQEVDDIDTASQSSWQSFKPTQGAQRPHSFRVRGQRLTRSKGTRIEFCLSGLYAAIDQLRLGSSLVSRTFITVRELEILDRIRTSTWDKFLTGMRTDFRGNIRETDSTMVRIELKSVRPVPEHPSEEARLRAKILPLRLYVDQDALDFLKKFFSFKDPNVGSPSPAADDDDGDAGIYFQLAEVFPIGLKLDYKPRRVDYRALRDGKTIELMNFFHFDGAEMTLRRIALTGITGWPRFFDLLNDLWTPDVKATQLAEVISGVAPIRSVVNVGSGVADLILLPIAQYKKDGRVVRGLQKGATAFVKSTATEAVKLGARLATGTQVILEQVEGALGDQMRAPITTEALDEGEFMLNEEDEAEPISRYAEQPIDVREGVESAYKSLRKNLSSAAQTILAVPMEVYEKSGSEGPVRAVIRAVPIAVLKPMIGASEAVSKTLLGLHNTLDPDIRRENEAKYKHH